MKKLNIKTVSIIGLGYIGLPLASVVAEKYKTFGIDINEKLLENLENDNIENYEPKLKKKLKYHIENKNLILSSTIKKSDIFIICLPTPLDKNKKIDLSFLLEGLNSIIPHLQKGNLIIIESTISVNTCEKIIYPFLEKSNLKLDKDIFLAYSPERVLVGNALEELINNARIIGGSKISRNLAKDFYSSFVKGKIELSDFKTVELIKLTENIYRDVNIAFAHELDLICEELKINTLDVINMANNHPRVNILSPSVGVGGHCLPVDSWFLINSSKNVDLIKKARYINEKRPEIIINRIEKKIRESNKKKIALLGITYKEDVNDMRNSAALQVAKKIYKNKNLITKIHDPYSKFYKENDLEFSELNEILKESEILVFLVNHKIYKEIDKSLLKDKIIIKIKG